MESKESARLKEIKDGLNKIDIHLKEQNQQLKSIAASLSAMHDRIVEFKKAHNMDVFGKQWHGDANATSNGNNAVITPLANIDTAFANLKEGIEKAADEAKRNKLFKKQNEKGDTNETK